MRRVNRWCISTSRTLELEPNPKTPKERSIHHPFRAALSRVQRASTVSELAAVVTQEMVQTGFSGARLEAIFTTCVWSSVNHASTPFASASARPSLTAASCVGDVACAASGITLISCSRTAVECETRTSPGFTLDND